ncbi:flavocytochrome c [Treponema phagedenis]|nr:flavocytochrome c [Treponema phagedenis]
MEVYVKRLFISLAAVMVLLFASCGNKDTYTGTAKGNNADITVQVGYKDGVIQSVKVTKHAETAGVADAALEKIPEAIVAHQSLNVDIISGATETSKAIVNAVKSALQSANADLSKFDTAVVKEQREAQELTTDVVVIGAGGAGLTAAITAASEGKKVIVLEKKSIAGGNSTLATGGMNAAKTSYQDKNTFAEDKGVTTKIAAAEKDYPALKDLTATVKSQYEKYKKDPKGYFDSVELFELDTMVGGKATNNLELVKTLTKNSKESLEWLATIGADLKSVGSFGGASVKRIHKPVNAEGKTVAVGSYLVPILEAQAKKAGVQIIFDTPAYAIKLTDSGVTVEAEATTVHAKSVVIATGGFAGNSEMVEKYKPELKGFATTNTSGITGDGIKIADALNAALVDMEQIQIHPTVEYTSKALITEGLRGDGAILVNQDGKRFFDETSTRDKVSAAEIAQKGNYAYLIIDQRMADASAVIQGYIKKGFTKTGKTIEELAKEIEITPETLAATLQTWNKAVEAKTDSEFNRTSFAEKLDTAPFYAIKVSPGVHHTMGGIKINSNAQVIDKSGAVIPHVYAAGEVTGGVHGANRLGGNAVADIIVFGRIAGKQAAANAGN